MTASEGFRLSRKQVPLIQGDCLATDDPNIVYTTVLGSCIAVCMFDAENQIGGMNHFLLPASTGPTSDDLRYGVNSMELLINGILKLGANRANLRCKVFGGSEMRKSFTDIGASNQKFTKDFLAAEGFPCLVENLGGALARKVQFSPCDGRARLRMLPAYEPPVEELIIKEAPAEVSTIELF